jgi:hypothetical protein
MRMVMVVKALVAAENLFKHALVDDFARRPLAGYPAILQA